MKTTVVMTSLTMELTFKQFKGLNHLSAMYTTVVIKHEIKEVVRIKLIITHIVIY